MYLLKLLPQHVQVIGEALADAPYKKVVEVMQVIQQQVTEQDTMRMKQGPEIKPAPPQKPSESAESGNDASAGNGTPKANGADGTAGPIQT
jgi:hypothetical protein